MHLAELENPDVLNSLLPGLGCDWGEAIISTGMVLYRTAVYATEWEAVAARWAADDHALLQPSEPGWTLVLNVVQNLLKQKVAKNELKLCGPSRVCPRVLHVVWGPCRGPWRANARVPPAQARREQWERRRGRVTLYECRQGARGRWRGPDVRAAAVHLKRGDLTKLHANMCVEHDKQGRPARRFHLIDQVLYRSCWG